MFSRLECSAINSKLDCPDELRMCREMENWDDWFLLSFWNRGGFLYYYKARRRIWKKADLLARITYESHSSRDTNSCKKSISWINLSVCARTECYSSLLRWVCVQYRNVAFEKPSFGSHLPVYD
jgi:hypothetical protein